MQYLVSVIDDTAGLATPDEMAAINAFNDRLKAEGHWVFAGGLAAPSSAADREPCARPCQAGPGEWPTSAQQVRPAPWPQPMRLPGREITLEIDAFCGKLILTVPAGAHVIDEGGALFAKRAVYGRQDPDDADGPVIRLVGEARFSKVAVHRGRSAHQAG